MKKNKPFKCMLTGMIILACMACDSKKNNCQLQEIKTLYSDISMHIGVDTGYANTVLIKGFSKNCIDSSTMVQIALRYIDTVRGNKPVEFVAFYSSDEDFRFNEHSQEMNKIDKSCLVKINFKHKTRNPDNFAFYNDKGEMIYFGDKWKPNGE